MNPGPPTLGPSTDRSTCASADEGSIITLAGFRFDFLRVSGVTTPNVVMENDLLFIDLSSQIQRLPALPVFCEAAATDRFFSRSLRRSSILGLE